MTWQEVFLDRDGVRPIWRCLLAVVMIVMGYAAVGIALAMVFGGLGRRPQLLTNLFWVNLLLLPALVGIFRIMTTVFDRKPLGITGLAFHGRARQEVALGLGLGAAMILTVAVLERLLGLATFHLTADSPQQLLTGGGFLFIVLLCAATNEELVFRGYAFQRLVDSVGPWVAIAVFSLLFGLGHLANPAHTWVSTINTMLIGVPLAAAYLRTRSLWMPIGMHFAWNFLQGYALGFQVSGLVLPVAFARPEIRGAELLTGGSYGPEGGLIAAGVVLFATGYVLSSKHMYVSEGMRKLLSDPKPSQERAESVGSPLGLID